jgi:hypothetical protein
MNKEIYLSISQISILIGKSPYGSLSNIIYNLWTKIDNPGYKKKISELELRYKKSFKNLSEIDKLNLLSSELGINDLEKKTYQAMKKDNHTSLLKEQDTIISEINKIEQNNLSNEELTSKKNALSKLVNSLSNRGFGNQHEKSAIMEYVRITNSQISNQQKIIIARIKKADKEYNAEWFIKGKIDGMAFSPNDGLTRIIEIKNRTKTLFKHLKEYEKPQIQTYMKLFDFNKGHLVEYLKKTNDNNNDNNDNNDNIYIIDVNFEPDYWNFINKRLLEFISFFYNFLKDQKLQELLLINNIDYTNVNEDSEIEKHFRELLNSNFSN